MKKKNRLASAKFVLKKLKFLWIVLAALIALAAAYFAYVMISYHRIGDMPLEIENNQTAAAKPDTEYTLLSWNIGFGAYEPDFGFFMDGGSESRAFSEERLMSNMERIADRLKKQNADLYLLQEVDFDSTRAWHVDERQLLIRSMDGMGSVFAQNYDSPFLLYPLTKPHGASKSGLMTLSPFETKDAVRVELPVETGLSKLLDLDRCYSKTRIPVEGGSDLVLYNFHLSAYTTNPDTANRQLELLLDDMQAEYEAGNWCLAGGDFNKDLLGDSSQYFHVPAEDYGWAKPLPEGLLDKYAISLAAPLDEEHPVPSCRNADGAYRVGQFVVTVDGFLHSENVEILDARVVDTSFANSDHNPVELDFKLIPAGM